MNILVIRMHRFGDVLQLTPMLQGLKLKYPSCRITFLTGREMSELLADNPDVDEIISIPEKKFRYHLKNKPECYAPIYNQMYELITDLKARNFHLIINRQYELGALLAQLIGAEQILGQTFSPERGIFLNDPVSTQLYDAILANRKTNRRNLVDWACHIAGLLPGCGHMCFPVSETDLFAAESLLAEHTSDNHPLVAVQLGAAKSFRRWGADNYLQVVRWLIESKGQKVVLVGTKDEKTEADSIHARLGQSNQQLIDLIGATDFKTLGGVLKKCRRLITGDTGTMHMAAAVGTPVIALFYGTAFPWETGPYGTGHLVLYAAKKCAPCLRPQDCVSAHACRKAVTPQHVCRAFEISEAVRENRITDIEYLSGNVKLYLTYAAPGADQTLVPINEISNIHDFSVLPCYSTAADCTAQWDNFNKKGLLLLQKLHRGDIEGFNDLFSEYVGQWIKLISFIKKRSLDETFSAALIQCLYPALAEATRAMQAQDYTVLSDLVQYDFKHALDLSDAVFQRSSSRCADAIERRIAQ